MTHGLPTARAIAPGPSIHDTSMGGVRNLEGEAVREAVSGIRRPSSAAEGGDVEVRAWGEGTGPVLYTATITAKNGRSVNGVGYTPEGAEEDALQAWMRGEA